VAADDIVTRVQSLVQRCRYRLSLHAERERDADRIQIVEVEEALGGQRLELIEDYPEDPAGSFAPRPWLHQGQPADPRGVCRT